MVKLNERKIRWIIHEKLRGRGTGELALIQRVSHRRVEQLWQAYKRDGGVYIEIICACFFKISFLKPPTMDREYIV